MTSEDPKKAAKDVAESLTDRTERVLSSAKAAGDAARDNVRDLAGRATDAAGEIYDGTKGHVREAVDRMPDASEAVTAGRKAYERSNRAVGRHVAKQPLEALLLAGAIGYLVGWATNRS